MADSTIEWTDKTWNPVRGCSVISPGCVNCYAMKQAHRFSGQGRAYEGLTKLTKAGPQWTGTVRTVEAALLEPLSWRKPRRVFVNSMSDLFHEDVPFEFIDQVFAVMALSRQHTYQILTKRAERMYQYMTNRALSANYWKRAVPVGYSLEWEGLSLVPFPLPNVWLGVSVEDQKHADERIPLLLQTPAAVRFISAEPLLGPVNLREVKVAGIGEEWDPYITADAVARPQSFGPRIDWVIVGGESGPGARPFDLAWARSIVQQCKSAGVACFVKQLGALPFQGKPAPIEVDGSVVATTTFPILMSLGDRKGGDPLEWPDDLRVREFPA